MIEFDIHFREKGPDPSIGGFLRLSDQTEIDEFVAWLKQDDRISVFVKEVK